MSHFLSLGVDEAYDASQRMKEELDADVQDYLGQMKRHFGSRDIKYFGSGPNAFQLEVPEGAAKKADDDFTLSSQKKGTDHTNLMKMAQPLEFYSLILPP